MRSDMNKVLVEEPRCGRAGARALAGSRRLQRHALDPDGEGGPQRVGMRRDAIDRKHFGEHLSPLYRYLDKQVHRPWAKVYGELCTQLDRRNVVQEHLFQHIDDHVAIRTFLREGEVWVQGLRWVGGMLPLARSNQALFVHPVTGILLPNRARVLAARRRRLERAAQRVEGSADRRAGLPGMAENVQWHRIDGRWYEVALAPCTFGDKDAAAFDVVLRRTVIAKDRDLLYRTYGRAGCYGQAKRQLGHKELRRGGLVSA
jgi:hypothetical protein